MAISAKSNLKQDTKTEDILNSSPDSKETVQNRIRAARTKDERLSQVRKVAEIEKPWVPQILLEALDDPSEKLREFIITELGRRNDYDLDIIYQRLAFPPWYVKSSCLKILAVRKDPRTIKHIESVLKDSNIDVRRSAIEALGEIGGKESLALLAKQLHDSNSFIRSSAEKALRKSSAVRFC